MGLRGPRALAMFLGNGLLSRDMNVGLLLLRPKEKEPVSLYVSLAVRIGFEEEGS